MLRLPARAVSHACLLLALLLTACGNSSAPQQIGVTPADPAALVLKAGKARNRFMAIYALSPCRMDY